LLWPETQNRGSGLKARHYIAWAGLGGFLEFEFGGVAEGVVGAEEEEMCRTYGACFFIPGFPALTGWANFCRAYGTGAPA
jgi:hypothetical protein